MPVIDYTPLIILMLVVMAYYTASKFDDWFRKSRELDKKLNKYDASTGEKVFQYSLDHRMREKHHELEEAFYRNIREHERIVDTYNRERAALIDQEQYNRLRAMGYDVIGGAESHLKHVESKPVGYTIKDQMDGVPE